MAAAVASSGMMEGLPVLKFLPATPQRMRRTMVCGIHAYLFETDD
jgi:hypothetical protein